MKKLVICFIFSTALFGATKVVKLSPNATTGIVYGGALDLDADLAGTPDPQFWGNAGYQDNVIVFQPPAGYRVQILSISGSLSSYVRGVVSPGNNTGLSWGIITTANITGGTALNTNQNCMAYIKQSLTSTRDEETTPFNFSNLGSLGLLGPDNTLISRAAVYLNTTGQIIHMEQAIVITYDLIPESSLSN